MTQTTAIVTGAAGGIGAAITSRLRERGWRVIGIDVQESSTADVNVQADLTDWAAVEEKLNALDLADGIRVLVNCAGVQVQRGPSLDLAVESLDRLFTHNLRPTFLLTQWARDRFAEGASIVNIGSISGVTTVEGLALYGAMKAALHSYSRSLARELAPRVRVNVVVPGYIETPLTSGMLQDEARVQELQGLIPLAEIGSPTKVADAVDFLVSGHADYISGALLPVDGGYLA